MAWNDTAAGRAARSARPAEWVWIMVLVLTSVFQFFRRAPFDGVVFGAAAVLLVLMRLRVIDIEASARAPRRGVAVVVAAGAGLLLILLPSHTPVMAAAVSALGAGILPTAWGRHHDPPAEGPKHVRRRRAERAWALLAVLACMWELTSYVLGEWSSAGPVGHPTISALVEPLLTAEPWRVLLVAGWVAAGAALVGHSGSR